MRLHLVKQSVHFPNHLALTILWICFRKKWNPGMQRCWCKASAWILGTQALAVRFFLVLAAKAAAAAAEACHSDKQQSIGKYCGHLARTKKTLQSAEHLCCSFSRVPAWQKQHVATLQSMLRTHETVHWYSNHYFLSSWLFQAFLDGKVRIGKQCLAGWSFSVLLLLK